MNNSLWQVYLQPMLGRVIAALLTGLAVKLQQKYAIILSPDDVANLSASAVTLVLIIYGVLHTVITPKKVLAK